MVTWIDHWMFRVFAHWEAFESTQPLLLIIDSNRKQTKHILSSLVMPMSQRHNHMPATPGYQ
jgi:hypothetical protein